MTKFQKGPEYSQEREFKVILEEIRSEFRVFGEGLERVNERLNRMEADVKELKSDMRLVKIALKSVATKDDLLAINRRLTALEAR